MQLQTARTFEMMHGIFSYFSKIHCFNFQTLIFRAKKLKCTNAHWPDVYGHYREAKFSQTKHHWWWKANRIFDQLRVTQTHNGGQKWSYYVRVQFHIKNFFQGSCYFWKRTTTYRRTSCTFWGKLTRKRRETTKIVILFAWALTWRTTTTWRGRKK